MLQRLEILIGKENIDKINKKTILIIGLGGVGGYALEAIARSNPKKIIIVDNDVVDITNLNRQLLALNSNIGKKKTDIAQLRIKDINPNIEVIKIDEFITKDNIDILFKEKIDYLIDACDTIETKKEIIRKCLKYKIKFIICCGTGKRMDPTKFKITDIRKTSYDPLSKKLRKMVNEEKITEKITVLSSIEQPINSDSKIIGSNSFVPATAGLLLASYVINDIVGDKNA